MGQVRLVKLDTQGYECRALEGARNALNRSSRLQVVASEVADTWLYQQCCRPTWLHHLLRVGTRWAVTCTGSRNAKVRSEYTCLGRPALPRGALLRSAANGTVPPASRGSGTAGEGALDATVAGVLPGEKLEATLPPAALALKKSKMEKCLASTEAWQRQRNEGKQVF